MLQVKTILKKFVLQKNNKNLDFKKIAIPLFEKITNNQTKCDKQFNTALTDQPITKYKNIITVHCVRHAESTMNALRNHNIKTLNIHELLSSKDPGILDAPLSKYGVEKANNFGDNGGPIYKGKPIMERASLIITSNLRRAMETSNLISKRSSNNCKICVLDFVREKALYLSDVPCLSKEEIIKNYPKVDISFLPDTNFKDYIVLPEDHEQVDQRIQQFINFIKNYQNLESNEIVLVSHYYFLKRLLKGTFIETLIIPTLI
ncbi:Histidine phosphatase [Cryptosporidium meleagridis]